MEPGLTVDLAVSGSRPGGQEESWAGEDQKPEEKVQTEGPGKHSETETGTTQEETDEQEQGSAGYSVKMTCIYKLITVQNNIFICGL